MLRTCGCELSNDQGERRTHRHLLQSYMSEFIWRNVMGRDPFENVLSGIGDTYPQ